MPLAEGSFKVWIYLGFIVGLTRSSRPRFDTSTDMRKVLIPPDADVDSVIFRLRATDEEPDFPLIFNVTATVLPVVRIENLPCTLYNKVCQANVILTRRLSPGKFYDFLVVVRDSKGENNSMQATISVTNGTTPRSKIFLHKPSLIMVPEDTKPGTELDYLIVQSNPWSNKPVYIELWQPKDLFKIIQRQTERQTQGIITLIGELDFETQTMHTLTMYATDPYTEMNYDTRNIVGLQVVVIVQDVQDVPPIFTLAPPLTKINNTIQPGDVILRVHAEDGDKGVPREVTYGLVSEYNPFTTYFYINETSGEISLARPLEELAQITRVGTPILLSVVAEEIRHSWDEPPAQATVVEIGILIGEPENSPPYFESDNYICYVEENADPGTILQFANPNTTKVKDDDIGKAGVFTLKLVNNNGTFEIAPSVAERSANFVISVRDNMLLDYEVYKTLTFKIFAQEVGPTTNLSASAFVTAFLKDVNDNPPEFDQSEYEVSLSENATVGTKVIQVHATDKDTGLFGKIKYTSILGSGSEAFDINSETGWITVTAKTDVLDREKNEKLELLVEARDEDGDGLKSTVKLTVNLIDINDNAPIFEKPFYEFRLNPEMNNFTAPAIIKAVDADAEPPNNVVRYEIIHGNYENKFKLDEITGELFVREQIRTARHARENEMQSLAGKFELRKEHQFSTVKLSGHRKHFIMTESSIENLKKNELESKINLIPQVRIKRADENPLFTLTIRAYDLGVPLMSSVIQVHILHGIVPGARIVTFVMPGEQLDPNKAAETLATITGGRVTIQEIRPYVDQSSQSDLSNTNSKKSVIVARVEQSNSETLVDIEKIRKNLAANGVGVISGMDGMQISGNHDSKTDIIKSHITNITNIQNEEVTVYKAENKLLLWLLIFFGLLLLLAIATVIFCCICPGCPFYMEPRKRRIHSSETLIIRADGKPKRHVQRTHLKTLNGSWPDRKQAWSADREHRNWQFNKRNLDNDYGPNSLPGDITQVTNANVPPTIRNADATIHNETVHIHKEQEIMRKRPVDKIFVKDVDVPKDSRTFDVDSIRRHEFERGSDIVQKSYRNVDEQEQIENYDDMEVREQHYYRDGNAEVLRLITRGHVDEQTPSKRQTEQKSFSYNGKDILLQRFMEDQKLRKEQLQQAAEINRANNEVIQPEIILIPGSLDQRHLENLRSDIQQLMMDRNDRAENQSKIRYKDKDDTPVPLIEVTKVVEKSLSDSNDKIIQYTLHDMELVRQNTLLTRLLLEREGKVVGGPTADVASYLETQSLPGQVAIATQTDRTAATQTDCRLRSRSDNESEDDIRLKRKFKFKKRYIEEECPSRVKSVWMKSPMSDKGRTYIGIKMAARRKMTEIDDRRKAISPVVLQEISESLNGNDHFSSNIEEEDEDERLFHYCHNPIKATKIEVCKETIEISTSSQEEMEHRIVRMSQRKNVDNVNYNSKCKKIFPIEPSFRVLEGDISPRKKIKMSEDKKLQKETSEITSEKTKDTKKISIQQKKISKTNRELKVKELKATMDTTISKILGHDKHDKPKPIAKPFEIEHKLRKPLKHQMAIKVDSGSSEIDDMQDIISNQRKKVDNTVYNHSKENKHIASPTKSTRGLRKVATSVDLAKSEARMSPSKSSKTISPLKKSTSSKFNSHAKSELKVSSREVSPHKHSSPKKVPNSNEVKPMSLSSSRTDKIAPETSTVKTKRKHKEEVLRDVNIEQANVKIDKTSVKERLVESKSQMTSSNDPEHKPKSTITKAKSTPLKIGKVDLHRVEPITIETGGVRQAFNVSGIKDGDIEKEKIICIEDHKKATLKVMTNESDQAKKAVSPIKEVPAQKQELLHKNSTESEDIESLEEISYTRLDDKNGEMPINTRIETEEPTETKEQFVEKKTDKERDKISHSGKPVFQKQKRVIDISEEEIESSDSVCNKMPVTLKKQFTDDFTHTLKEMKTCVINTNQDEQEVQNAENKNLSQFDDKKQSHEEPNDSTLISKTIFKKESTDEQTLKTTGVTEVLDQKLSEKVSDLCVTVGEVGNHLAGDEKFEQVSKKLPKLERSERIISDSFSEMTKESLNVDDDSETSDESDLSCKTMLNRNSLERKQAEIKRQTGVTESKDVIENVTFTDANLTSVEESKIMVESKSEIKQSEINVEECEKHEKTTSEKYIETSKTNNEKVQQFTEDKHHPINVSEKKVASTEKPLQTIRLAQDIAESKDKEVKSVVAKKLVIEKEQQKSKSQIETCEHSKKDKSSRKEDDKNPSKSLKVERRKKLGTGDIDTEKKIEKSPSRMKGSEPRSRYMAWYTEKRKEMEQKREEKRLTEEEESRPRWTRKAKIKSDVATVETTQDRRKIKPLINVESEQLKAIVRQGRKMRKGRVEDPSVQIFVPERPPPQTVEGPSTPRHHLIQHSEYKYEKEPPPFYLHPPPAPHPSPEHFPDCPMRECVHEDDIDSGIAVSLSGTTKLRHQQLLEKKSVFDIAYSEASPTKLCSDSSTPPAS